MNGPRKVPDRSTVTHHAAVTNGAGTFPEDHRARLRSLARGLVSLAELADVEAALTVVDQLRDVLVGMRPSREDLPTRYDRILENDDWASTELEYFSTSFFRSPVDGSIQIRSVSIRTSR